MQIPLNSLHHVEVFYPCNHAPDHKPRLCISGLCQAGGNTLLTFCLDARHHGSLVGDLHYHSSVVFDNCSDPEGEELLNQQTGDNASDLTGIGDELTRMMAQAIGQTAEQILFPSDPDAPPPTEDQKSQLVAGVIGQASLPNGPIPTFVLEALSKYKKEENGASGGSEL